MKMKKITTIMSIVLVGLLFTATAYSHETKYDGGYLIWLDELGKYTRCKTIHLSPYGVFASNEPLKFDNEGSANRWPKKGQKFEFYPYTEIKVIMPTTD